MESLNRAGLDLPLRAVAAALVFVVGPEAVVRGGFHDLKTS
jgi:hypothetical protein